MVRSPRILLKTYVDGLYRNSSTVALTPPIPEGPFLQADSSAKATRTFELDLPAISFHKDRYIRPNRTPTIFLAFELKTPRLNAIHKHLWLAGLPNAARPLHRQRLLGRRISITEDPDEHLVWFEDNIYLKPLSDHLLDHDHWTAHLCSDEDLYRSACGMLMSYAWLIRYKSDLSLAKESGLVSEHLTWANWVKILETFFDNINASKLHQVNKRYRYGELRLSRLNAIYRYLPPELSFRNIVRGYRTGSTSHRALFERNFKWLLVMFAVLSVFLSALQVSLAIPKLQDKHSFQNVAFGVAVISLITILAGVILVFTIWAMLFWYHLVSTWRLNTKTTRQRDSGNLST
jgi:hypothetical protein